MLMNGRTHTVIQALRSLDKLGVKATANFILTIPPHRLGNKSWGLVDFLIKQNAFIGWRFVGAL